jgi:hypothetical protein
MKSGFWLDHIPLWGVFFLIVACVFLIICIGTVFGLRISRRPDHEKEAPLGTITGSSLALLGFMLAFTFGIAAEIFQNRRQLLLDEVNAIGTTYLRAGLLREPHQTEIRKLLCEYVDLRVNLARNPEKFQEIVSNSEKLQGQMWSHAVSICEADRSSPIDALFIDSLNSMIDLQTSRVTVSSYRIPHSIWYAIAFVTALAMLMVGYQIGISGRKNLKIALVLALTFSTIVFLIVDLDRTTEGYLRVSQKPMFELQKQMQLSTEKTSPAEKVEIHAEK